MTLEDALYHLNSLLAQIRDRSIASSDLIEDGERDQIDEALDCAIHLCEGILA